MTRELLDFPRWVRFKKGTFPSQTNADCHRCVVAAPSKGSWRKMARWAPSKVDGCGFLCGAKSFDELHYMMFQGIFVLRGSRRCQEVSGRLARDSTSHLKISKHAKPGTDYSD